VITDAGFHNDWFKKVVQLEWDYVGRVRGNKTFCQNNNQKWKAYSEVYKKATSFPASLGKSRLCTSNPLDTHLYLYKGKWKGIRGYSWCAELDGGAPENLRLKKVIMRRANAFSWLRKQLLPEM
jgi:hypothetical protein